MTDTCNINVDTGKQLNAISLSKGLTTASLVWVLFFFFFFLVSCELRKQYTKKERWVKIQCTLILKNFIKNMNVRTLDSTRYRYNVHSVSTKLKTYNVFSNTPVVSNSILKKWLKPSLSLLACLQHSRALIG